MPTPSKHRSLTAKFAASRFFTTSLLIHLALVSLLGGVVLFKAAQTDDGFASVGGDSSFLQTDELGSDEAEAQPAEFEEAEIASTEESYTPPAQSAISTLAVTPTNWSTSASMEHMGVGTHLSAMKPLSTKGLGVGAKGGASQGFGGGSKMSGTLYGVKIESNKLGVILDVSGSAHPYLIHAIKELEKNFRNAEIILYPGCGMAANALPENYQILPAKSVEARFEAEMQQDKVVFGQIGKWVKNNPKEADTIRKLLNSENTYVSVNPPTSQQTAGCQFAFEKLLREGVDTIYWFADFGDSMNEEIAEDLARRLRARGIQVIAHNFVGQPVRPEAMLIVEKTGGTAISEVPGKGGKTR